MDILLSIARASELPVFMNCDSSVATIWALSLVDVDQSPIQDISQHYIFRVGDGEGLCKGERTGNVTADENLYASVNHPIITKLFHMSSQQTLTKK